MARLRDDTNAHSENKPAGGWYVTPIHAVLLPRSGKVVLTGTERIAQDSCNGSTQRNYGVSFVLDPAQIDAVEDGATIAVQPIDEQARGDDVRHVLYCSGQIPLTDGRVLYVAGTDYPRVLPITSPELGLDYSRVFDPDDESFTRVSSPMKGGPSVSPGMKWYPTNRLLPDGRVLIAGGYHWSVSGPGDHENRSLEIFDPAVWDADPDADPYTVLSQPEDIPGTLNTAGRAYTHVFLLPRPVAAARGGGVSRTVALIGSVGDMWLFNHEPGLDGSDRIVRMPNASMPRSGADKGEGSTSVMLPDGRIMIMGGGRDGAGAALAYFYDPYEDAWDTLQLGVARIFPIATWLPDGTVLLLNGYTNEIGSPWALDNAPGGADGVRRPQIIDPFAKTVKNEEPWPEPTARGYHSWALLLRDGRVLIGGGKDNVHDTGCEKNETRIYSPPYLSAGPRPEITNVEEGQPLTVGGAPLTIEFSGTVRAERGVALMAPGGVTHSYNQNQRYLPLRVVSGPSAGSITVAPPDSLNEAPPGEYLLHLISEQGVPSLGTYVRLVPPAACVYAVDPDVGVFLEGEGSSRRAGLFQRIEQAGRGNDAYVQVDPAASRELDYPDEGSVLWYDLDVASAASVHLWLLGAGGTLWASVDAGPDQELSLESSDWGWVRAETALELSAGKHTLKIKAGASGAKLDRLWLTRDANATAPEGLGEAAQDAPCSRGVPTEPSGGGASATGGSSGSSGVGVAGAKGGEATGGGAMSGGGVVAGGEGVTASAPGSGCGCRVSTPSDTARGAAALLSMLVMLLRRRARLGGGDGDRAPRPGDTL